ncbi:MAG: hypothetical protein R3324_13460 [Halobacteriales archaeon]|nr:hypothetical protein [Halobacteriales archaeon]
MFGDFGGYYYRTRFVAVTGWVHLGSGVVATVFVLLLIAGLVLSLQATLSTLRAETIPADEVLENAARSVRGAAFTVAVTVLGGILFVVLNLDSDEWWFDAGFYAALLGGIVVAYLGKQIHDDLAGDRGREGPADLRSLLGGSIGGFGRLARADLERAVARKPRTSSERSPSHPSSEADDNEGPRNRETED